MELTPFVDSLRAELAAVAEAGGPEAKALAERLTSPLESALRLALLEALSAAAAEITVDLAPGSVELRLRGREPSFAVIQSAQIDTRPTAAAEPTGNPAEPEDGAVARINLRVGENLKSRIDAAAAQAGMSVNSWLIRAANAALTGPEANQNLNPAPRGQRGSQRQVGWVR